MSRGYTPRFHELEYTLFSTHVAVIGALKTADDVSRELKVEAYNLLLRCELAAFQIGSIFAPLLAKSKIYRWGNVFFVGFDRDGQNENSDADESAARVVVSLSMSVVEKTVAEVAIPKLSGLFRYRALESEGFSYLDVLNFAHVVGSKGASWENTAQRILERCPRNAYYLWLMSGIIITDVNVGVLKTIDIERCKNLLAYVQAKRSMAKMRPTVSAVKLTYKRMVKQDMFSKMLGGGKTDADLTDGKPEAERKE